MVMQCPVFRNYRLPPTYWGQPNGTAKFYPNMKKISEEEHSEQLDRMKQGLLPNMNDLGAVIAAKNTLNQWGDEG
jgi:hypothetical protein